MRSIQQTVRGDSRTRALLCAGVMIAFLAGGCQPVDNGAQNSAVDGEIAADEQEAATGAAPEGPGPMVDIAYAVVGNPLVGVPVAINLVVTSDHAPLELTYRISDSSALTLQSGQMESVEIIDAAAGSAQQVTVIPQREGRLYLNVSAEMPSASGTLIRSIAVPIQVDRAPPASAPVTEAPASVPEDARQ